MDPCGTWESKILDIPCLLLILTCYFEIFNQENKIFGETSKS